MKPQIQYIDALPPELGYPARILVSRGWLRTTQVKKITLRPTGPIIETLNTVYTPPTTDEFQSKVSSIGLGLVA